MEKRKGDGQKRGEHWLAFFVYLYQKYFLGGCFIIATAIMKIYTSVDLLIYDAIDSREIRFLQ
jgi:hypothetical protein